MAITTTEGSYQDYAYTGGMQKITIPQDGIYKFEAWGAGGMNCEIGGTGSYGLNYGENNKGGYSAGYRLCKKGEVIFICVGGCASRYNGGGACSDKYGCTGGGATHFATATGLLSSLADNKAAVLLVAGGGGGVGQYANSSGSPGGGLTGGGSGGTQTGPSSVGYMPTQFGSFGQGGQGWGDWIITNNADNGSGGGGGGGWYGGNGGNRYIGGGADGGGGSGYIGGIPAFTSKDGTTYSPVTTTGAGSATNKNGAARVTFVRRDEIPVKFDGKQVKSLIFNGTKITSLIYNGTTIFCRWAKEQIHRLRFALSAGAKRRCAHGQL